MRLAVAVALALLTATTALFALEPFKPRGKSKEYKAVLQEIDRQLKAKKPSVASGTHAKGKLENAAELVKDGFGYRLSDPRRKTHFGTDEMVFGLMELAALWQELHPGQPWFSIGDISREGGGKNEPHINHQDGQDVDIAFQYRTGEGEPVDRGWLACDATGKARAGGDVWFDEARNFEFLALWLESPICGECEWIFIAEPLKKLVIDHGKKLLEKKPGKKPPANAEAIERITTELQKLLREPSSSPHADHFHVRLKRKRG